MNTGKLITIDNLRHHSSNHDEDSYIPVTRLKTQEELVEKLNDKTKVVHVYKNYHSLIFWCNSLQHSFRHEFILQNKKKLSRNVVIRPRNTSSLM